jgi:beta-glucanase (GH16 family)
MMVKPETKATLLFEDDFDILDWNTYLSRWWYVDPAAPGCSLPSNGELQLYVNEEGPLEASPWTVKDSILSLTASKVSPPVDDGHGNRYGYVSGMLNTYPSFYRVYGFFEARLKMPPGVGMWPAFWLLPMDGSWPPEIDVVEWLGRDPLTEYLGTHSGTGPSQGGPYAIPDGSADFHDYGVDWQANEIAFYFDGVLVAQFPTPLDMHKPMYLILNLAIGGGWGGDPAPETVFPAALEVDWLRAYDSNPYASGGGGGGVGTVYVIPNAWASVDLRPVFKPGDVVAFDFEYAELQILSDGVDSHIWIKTTTTLTLAVIVPGHMTTMATVGPSRKRGEETPFAMGVRMEKSL